MPEDQIVETDQQNHSLLNDIRFRGWVAQALVLMLLFSGAAFAIYNIAHNLHNAGITTGFGFLSEPSGFDISQTLVEYSSRDTYARALLVGVLNTLLVAGLGIVFSTFLGFFWESFACPLIGLFPEWLPPILK